MNIKTWMHERAVVGIILLITWYCAGHTLVDGIAAIAVLFTFSHAQIADRMQERQAIKETPDVHCYKWTNRHFIVKELLWITFFIMTKSYSAIIGAVIFVAYPFWRKVYRKHFPITCDNANGGASIVYYGTEAGAKFFMWMEALKQQAYTRNPRDYKQGDKWMDEYFKTTYYDKSFTPEDAWTDYTTMIQ